MSSNDSVICVTTSPGGDASCAPPVVAISEMRNVFLHLRNVGTLSDIGSQYLTMRSRTTVKWILLVYPAVVTTKPRQIVHKLQVTKVWQ